MFNDVVTLRVLKPNVLKPFDFIEAVRIIPEIKVRSKNQQNRIVIRSMAREMIVSSSSELRKPRRASTKSV
jgi:hypothetical protein